MKRILILAAALLMAACQPLPANDGQTDLAQVPTPPRAAGSEDPVLCAAAGGKMLPQGRLQSVRCVVTYADARRRCTDGDDCAGDCRVDDVADAPASGTAAVGQCQVNSSRFGCYTTVEDGKAEATICVD